jgi:hypothetical protein
MAQSIFKICLLFGFLIFSITSCSNPKPKILSKEEIVRKNVEEYLKTKLNDPESYEFVELKIIDSVLYKDNIKYRTDMFESRLKREKENLESQLNYKETLPSFYNEEEVLLIESDIEKNTKILSEIDSLVKP